jgi:hypothetical protein
MCNSYLIINIDGALDREEFAIAYHLCQAGIKGIAATPRLKKTNVNTNNISSQLYT